MRTLICIRQLPYSQDTIRFGSLVAKLEKASIVLMTVVEDDDSIPEAIKGLDQARSFLDRPTATTKVRKGHAQEEILKESQENEYDILVIGAHYVAGFLDKFLGTVTGKVADKASMSVLVVRESRPVIQRILIAIGGQKMNRNLIETGANLAQAAGAEVTVLYVTTPVPSMYTGLDGIEETLEELLQTDTPIAQHLRWSAQYLADQGIESEVEIRHGVVADEIIREAMKGQYDLVVIGPAPLEGTLRRLMMDKVTPQVVDKAPCSVLVVRQTPIGS
jgi:nucleotide-binding universal stress UspA family protein